MPDLTDPVDQTAVSVRDLVDLSDQMAVSAVHDLSDQMAVSMHDLSDQMAVSAVHDLSDQMAVSAVHDLSDQMAVSAFHDLSLYIKAARTLREEKDRRKGETECEPNKKRQTRKKPRRIEKWGRNSRCGRD